jgi:hypothetical protein
MKMILAADNSWNCIKILKPKHYRHLSHIDVLGGGAPQGHERRQREV